MIINLLICVILNLTPFSSAPHGVQCIKLTDLCWGSEGVINTVSGISLIKQRRK